MTKPGPLAGIRVIDFGRFIAGPYCGMLLADMGADVVRVDRRHGSEDRYTAPITDHGEGAGFLSLNRNKRSITLDSSKPGSADVIRRLVKTADVVVANLPIAVLKKMGLDYEALCVIKPDIILARVSTFGPDGPYANRHGFDAVAQAMSGAMQLTGFPGPPIRETVPFEDYGTALHTAFGVMVALYHRARTGEGQIVDGSLLATGVTFMQALLAERHVIGAQRKQQGNAGWHTGPSDTYRTKDGWIVVFVIGSDMFARWAKLVGREELIDDQRFATDLSRADNRDVITETMNAWLATRPSPHLKPGGILLLTVPFTWDEHEQPYDYARYSSFGLKHLLETNGFEIVAHIKSENNIKAIFQLLNAYIYKLSKFNKIIKIVSTLIIMGPLSILGILLNLVIPSNNDFYLDNIILAKKI